MSQEKIVQQQTKNPVKGATAEQLESWKQDAQKRHSEILGGIDSSRDTDVQALLNSSSSAQRSAGASGFDNALGLKGGVVDLLGTADDREADGDSEPEGSDDAGNGDDGSTNAGTATATATRKPGKAWKRDENVLRARRKFVQENLTPPPFPRARRKNLRPPTAL